MKKNKSLEYKQNIVRDDIIRRLGKLIGYNIWPPIGITEDEALIQLKSLIQEWKEKCSEVSLATFAMTNVSPIYLKIHLKPHFSTKLFSALLNADIHSAEILPIYIENAILHDDGHFCERILTIAKEYGLDANNISIGRFTPLSYAAFFAAPECIRFIAKNGAAVNLEIEGNGADKIPLITLQDSEVRDAGRLVASFEALVEVGSPMRFHKAHCMRIERGAGELLRGHYIEHGLNLNRFAHEPDNHFNRNHFLPRGKEGSRLPTWIELSKQTIELIDAGLIVPAELRIHLLFLDYEGHPEKYLPMIPLDAKFLTPASIKGMQPKTDYGKIECFLANGLPAKNLACRCFSFGMLDKDMFDAILKAENKQRTKLGEPALSAEQFFKRLPPFVQNDVALVSIRQTISHAQAAASEGIGTLRTAAKQAGKNRSELE